MKLFLKEIKDRYIQENFKRIQRQFDVSDDATSSGGGGDTIVNNTIVNPTQPLDGTVDITGTIIPDPPSTNSLGSVAAPFDSIHTDELYVGPNSLYVDGHKAIGIDPITNRLTYSNDNNADLEVKSKGTGKLYIDSEGDIIITSLGTVTVNGNVIASHNFGRDIFEIPTDITGGNQVTLTNAPITNTDVVILNGLVMTEGATYDYILTGNTITFNPDVLTQDGLIRVDYAYN